MITSCSIVIRKPFGQEQATLGVRAAWAMLTNADVDAKIILLGNGVYSALGKAGYVKKMFDKFIEAEGEVYAVKEDVASRGLSEDAFPDGVKFVSAKEIGAVVDDTESVMTF